VKDVSDVAQEFDVSNSSSIANRRALKYGLGMAAIFAYAPAVTGFFPVAAVTGGIGFVTGFIPARQYEMQRLDEHRRRTWNMLNGVDRLQY